MVRWRNVLIMTASFPLFFPLAGLLNTFIFLVIKPGIKITCWNLQDNTLSLKLYYSCCLSYRFMWDKVNTIRFVFQCFFRNVLFSQYHSVEEATHTNPWIHTVCKTWSFYDSLVWTSLATFSFATKGTWKWRNLYISPSALT